MKNILSNQIKICHVTTVDITVRFIILNFLRFLREKNYKVSVVCSPGKQSPFFKKEGFSFYEVKMTRKITPLKDLISLLKLFLYFKKERFTIVHTYTPKAGILGRIAARMAGVPIVIHTSFGFYIGPQVSTWVKRLILFAEKIASYFCDLIFSQNKEDIELAVKKKIVNPKKIKFSTYGINITRFNSLNFSQEFIYKKKKELDIGEGKKIIGMVGRFVKEKGYLDLFKAFKIVRTKNPDVVLLLIAPLDKEKNDALNYSIFRDYGIEKEVIVLGREGEISDIEEFYSLMDIFVLPSYREGFPYSIMEASAMGRPVVATDIRGCREAVEDRVTGILVPAKNPYQLAQALIYLLDNQEKSEELGRNGRRKAEKEFDERLVFDRIEEEYQRLIKEKIKRCCD